MKSHLLLSMTGRGCVILRRTIFVWQCFVTEDIWVKYFSEICMKKALELSKQLNAEKLLVKSSLEFTRPASK